MPILAQGSLGSVGLQAKESGRGTLEVRVLNGGQLSSYREWHDKVQFPGASPQAFPAPKLTAFVLNHVDLSNKG